MEHSEEYNDLLYKLRLLDTRHEFKAEWENDINMIKLFIQMNKGNFLPCALDTFGTYLTRLRDFKGLKNIDIANRTGLPESTISKYLRDCGRTKPYTIAIMIAFQLEPKQIDAVFSLAEFRLDRNCKYNNIVNHYIYNSSENAVAECNIALGKLGEKALTTIGTDEYYK